MFPRAPKTYAKIVALELEGLLTEVLDSGLEWRWILQLDGYSESEQVVDSHGELLKSLSPGFCLASDCTLCVLELNLSRIYMAGLSPVIMYGISPVPLSVTVRRAIDVWLHPSVYQSVSLLHFGHVLEKSLSSPFVYGATK